MVFSNNRESNGSASAIATPIVETVVSPFHCLYQDALYFHKQSRLWKPRSEAEAGRLAHGAGFVRGERGGVGSSSGGGVGTAGIGTLARRSDSAAAARRGLGAFAGDRPQRRRARGAWSVRSRRAPLAAIRRIDRPSRFLDLSRTGRNPPRVLSGERR